VTQPEPSQACTDLVMRSEGFTPVAKMDCGSLAIGYGHHGPEVVPGLTWTQMHAAEVCQQDIQTAYREMIALVKVPLTQGQVDALVDFVYEEGSGRLAESYLLTVLNQGRYAAVPDQLVRQDADGSWHGWVMAEGAPSMGLVARRQAEVALFNS
jgi:lysozyme